MDPLSGYKGSGEDFLPKMTPPGYGPEEAQPPTPECSEREKKSSDRKFLRSLASGACLEEAARRGGFCGTSLLPSACSPPSQDPRGTGLGPAPEAACPFLTAWTLTSRPWPSVWVSRGLFTPISQMRKSRPGVICPSSHATPGLLTPGPGPRRAQAVGRELVSCPADERAGPRGENALSLVPPRPSARLGGATGCLSLCPATC